MLSRLLPREETVAERLQKALDACALAEQAVRDLEASLRAVKADPEAADPDRAIRLALEERQRLAQELARRQEALDLAKDLVDSLDGFAYDQLAAARRRQAGALLSQQAATQESLGLLERRRKELDDERAALDERMASTKAQITAIAVRMRELQKTGRVRHQVLFTNTTREEIPAKYPMRLTEWQRLWDAAQVTGLTAFEVAVNRDTGRIVRLYGVRQLPGFETLDEGESLEVVG